MSTFYSKINLKETCEMRSKKKYNLNRDSYVKKYSIGLDIGTNSVGWSVVYDDYKVPVRKMKVLGNTDRETIKKNLLGVLLFDEGNTAEKRRMYRSAKRSSRRKRNRIRYLQEIFSNGMKDVDENFFYRLDETFRHQEDKEYSSYGLFSTENEEKEYFKKFPTIYHLRQHLTKYKEKADLRLVYLAIAHMIKYRGNFLYEEFNAENIGDIDGVFKAVVEKYNEVCEEDEILFPNVKFQEVFLEKTSKTEKAKNILEKFKFTKKNKFFENLIKLSLGLSINWKTVFSLDDEVKVQLSKETYEDDLEHLLSEIGDQYSDLFYEAKKLYDSILLASIINIEEGKKTNSPLSDAMVKRFEEHQKDLKKLKDFIKQYSFDKYNEIFKNASNSGYAGYIDGKVSEADFYKYLKDSVFKELQHIKESEYFLDKIEQEDFLRKQRTFDNGIIPHQIHLLELQSILTNQSKYYPFLKENKEKIEKILSFRIPYYAGPLAQEGKSLFAWVVRKNGNPIRPWNFDEVVDKEKSAQQFIERLTNNDLYLPDEKVLPKHSMLYQKYIVFNELTKIKYMVPNSSTIHYFDAELKRKIFDNLFKKHQKVTKDRLIKYLKQEENNIDVEKIIGLDEEKNAFNATYKIYHDLKKVLGEQILDNPENEQMLEEIILILTLFEDRNLIENRLKKYSDRLGKDIIRKLKTKHYKGWGRLSKKLLNGIRDKESRKTILDYLVDDDNGKNRNLMQLIRDENLSFKETIEEAQKIDQIDDIEQVVADLPGSPAIKKGILQSIKIVDELIHVMKKKPDHIVIEMAREVQGTKKGTESAKKRYEKVKKGLEALKSDLLKKEPVENEKLLDKKLYLYYLQNGKDIYTGKNLDINNLKNYDIDHIIPQSILPGDSFENIVLTTQEQNRRKSNNLPSADIIHNMSDFWEKLNQAGLISDQKLANLKKGNLKSTDRARFINRQLVETRQITKHVAQILDVYLNNKLSSDKESSKIEIVTLKSSLVSQFRETFGLFKMREINDYHHAHDAYLNTVIARALLKKYPQLAPGFVYGKFFNNSDQRSSDEKLLFYLNVLGFMKSDDPQIDLNGEIAWHRDHDLPIIKKVLSSPQVNIVKKREIQTGQFSNETILPKGDSDKLIPLKTKEFYLNPKKYGGLDTVNIAYTVAILADMKKGKKIVRKKELVAINVMDRKHFENNPTEFLDQKGYHNVEEKSIVRLPKYSLFEFENGVRRLLTGKRELQKANQLVLPYHLSILLCHAQRFIEKDNFKSKAYVEKHQDEFKLVIDQIGKFASQFVLIDDNLEKIKNKFKEYLSLPVEKQSMKLLSESMINLLTFTRFGPSVSFTFFGEKIEGKRYHGVGHCLSATLIHQSVTGLYETRIDLNKFGED